ncbi:hypothetical protein [Hymenobacter cavernae]|uniref:Uncharacterized protein n=1 Tax=Hymenobacter cavernae TaxID=2044852 RepID=A0ABQ1UMT9_9BACT|nr:hypothetical protein [Hymenobacter cavernae]GGF22158.1 hypothetical protein GCM10011383_37210 [Hymenobacter cavernae]
MQTHEIKGGRFYPGDYNNYLIAGNLINAFAIGAVGSEDDFFLIGMEPFDESPMPLISGRVFDSEGALLFSLDKNNIINNQHNFTFHYGDNAGYAISDSTGKLILKVQTKFQKAIGKGNQEFESWITTITANLYNKKGELVFEANSGEPDERILAKTNLILGFSKPAGLPPRRAFALPIGNYSPADIEYIGFVLNNHADIKVPLRGDIEGQKIILDGKVLQDVNVSDCDVIIDKADIDLIGDNKFNNCKITFTGNAEFLYYIFTRFNNPSNESVTDNPFTPS